MIVSIQCMSLAVGPCVACLSGSIFYMSKVFNDDSDDSDDDYPGMTGRIPDEKKKAKEEDDEDSYFSKPKEIQYEPKYYACDNASTLYMLNLDSENFKVNNYKHETSNKMSKPYFIKRIPRSNLLLVVVNSTYPAEDEYYKETTEPITINYNVDFPCHKLSLNDLPRMRLEECFTEHPDVSCF